MVLFAKGLRGISRIHLLMGIFGYLTGPLWLLFLLTFHWMRWSHQLTGLSNITVPGFTPYLNLTGTQHAFLVFLICMIVLMLPKALSLIDLALHNERRRNFGGLGRATAGTIGETVFSTLHAPLQMLWHTRFVFTLLSGRSVNWGSQKRSADSTTWLYAAQRHWGHTVIGLAWGALVWELDRATFWWIMPVLTGMTLSIPLSVLTSRRDWGARAQELGLFLTPEETERPPELASLNARMMEHKSGDQTRQRGPNSDIADAVLDPYVNAIHVSLQREKRLNPGHTETLERLGKGQENVQSLGEKLLAAGPGALTETEKLLVLSDAETMSWLHRQAWFQPSEKLAPWWQEAIRRYSR
jgi:membrane glycosyltransferase